MVCFFFFVLTWLGRRTIGQAGQSSVIQAPKVNKPSHRHTGAQRTRASKKRKLCVDTTKPFSVGTNPLPSGHMQTNLARLQFACITLNNSPGESLFLSSLVAVSNGWQMGEIRQSSTHTLKRWCSVHVLVLRSPCGHSPAVWVEERRYKTK